MSTLRYNSLKFRRVGIVSMSMCGMYRTRELRPGLFISERAWGAGEKSRFLYAPWCFIGFGKTEKEARNQCRQHALRKSQIDAKQILKELGIPTS